MLGVVGVHSWQLALFPEQAQQDVWADDPTVLISHRLRLADATEGYELFDRRIATKVVLTP